MSGRRARVIAALCIEHGSIAPADGSYVHIAVATAPGSSFHAHPDLGRTRIYFCCPKASDVLGEAGRRRLTRAR
jgi:aspartate/methionine/tyrosine aminotransferase